MDQAAHSTLAEPAIAVDARIFPCRRSVRIGDVSLAINASSDALLGLAPELSDFEVESPQCHIELDVEFARDLEPASGKKIFDSGSLWTLRQSDGEFVFDFTTPALGTSPYKRMYVDQTFRKARIQLNGSCLNSKIAYPLEYPVDELLVTHWLARGHGLEVHGCGIVEENGSAFLFLGHSGAGKSTTTQLWRSHRAVHVLSDDRIILRRDGSEIRMYGTPWHGDAGLASPASAGVSRIFVLEHGSENELTRLPVPQAAAELFARAFVPFYDAAALDFALSYVHQVAELVPCYSFKFRPDYSAVDRILEFDD